MLKLSSFTTPQSRLVLAASFFLMLTGNRELFERLLEVYPLTVANLPFLVSLALFFTVTTTLFLLVATPGRAGRWILPVLLLAASQAAYYMDQYAVVIDTVMLDNIFATNAHEAAGLLSWSLAWRTLVFGILPAWLVWRYWPKTVSLRHEFTSRLKLALLLVIGLVLVVAPFTAGYASFIREHKTTRMYANPTFFTYSVFHYLGQKFKQPYTGKLTQVAADARMMDAGHTRKELIILVVGETARADRFSLNGYHRPTNPLLAKENVVSMTNVTSCGTSTGESVPCMFSSMKHAHFDREKALHIENVLDVLFEHGVQILWRDNNSDSKGVATRMQYEDFKSPTHNPACDTECRDIGMLSGLDKYIASKKGRDVLIVLHQMGNHGPEYYRRYTKKFERFTPTCKSSELQNCTKQEIDNAYDNAIVYTDYFLSEVIQFLKKYDGDYATAMLYVSDHGESLGEHGIYLHAAPYMIAPKEQTHIPAIVWLGPQFDYKIDQLKPYRDFPVSHDDLFCTLLSGFEVDTKMCEGPRDILKHNPEVNTPPAS